MSGQEKKVADSIREQAAKKGLDKNIEDIVIPTERVVEVRKGKKVDVEKKFLPGYILIKMEMNDDLWHVIKSVPRVGGFLGVDGKPQEVSEREINSIMNQIETSAIARKQALVFEVGDSVKVNDGPFESFVGVIEEVDDSKQRLKVFVTIFGRSTPLDLGFNQVTKV